MAKDEEDDLSDLEFEEDDEFDPLDDESLVPFEDDEETSLETGFHSFVEEEDLTEDSSIEVATVSEESTENMEEPNAFPSAPPLEEGPFSINEVPLDIIVELGTIQLPLNTILDMEPGNLLTIDTEPNHGVHLSVRGKRIAKGELIKIGDNLGVRIVELGHKNTD